jgi:hypothetical protein
MTQDTDLLHITTLFPGLPVRPIGPGDDVVVSEQALQDWLTRYIAEEKPIAYEQGRQDMNNLYRDGGIIGRKFLDKRTSKPQETEHE